MTQRNKGKPSSRAAAARAAKRGASGPSNAEGAPQGALLKRKEAAKMLGWSESKVRRNEGSLLNPIVADGVHLFRAEEIETMRRVSVVARQTPADYDGAMAARVFALLDEGLHPVEIAKRTSLDPRAVTAIYHEWSSMLGGFVVAERHLVELEMMPWLQGAFPIPSADELIAVIKQSVPDDCIQCKTARADFCGGCVARFTEADEAKRIAAYRAQAAQASQRREVERGRAREQADARRRAQARATSATSTPPRRGQDGNDPRTPANEGPDDRA